MTGVYQEIVEPERLVFTSAALDENGSPLFAVLNTVIYTERAARRHRRYGRASSR